MRWIEPPIKCFGILVISFNRYCAIHVITTTWCDLKYIYLKYTSHLVEVILLYKRCFSPRKKRGKSGILWILLSSEKMFCNLSTCYLCRCHSGYILWLCNSLFTMDIGNYVALQIFLSRFSWSNIHATMCTILYHMITSYYLAGKITIVHMTVYL